MRQVACPYFLPYNLHLKMMLLLAPCISSTSLLQQILSFHFHILISVLMSISLSSMLLPFILKDSCDQAEPTR